MNRNRDERGRFIGELREDAENVFSLCLAIYKLIPLVILTMIMFKYFDLSKTLEEIFLIIGCGKGYICVPDNGANGKKEDF